MRSPLAANYYDIFDEVYRASWGLALHHGWFERGPAECDVAIALHRFQQEIIKRLELNHATPLTLCDVGCGYGAMASSLWQDDLVAESVGVTDSRAQIHHGSRILPRANEFQIQREDWIENSLPAEAFDRVLAIESLYHFRDGDKGEAIREIVRVLRPGGRVVATLWLGKDESTWCSVIDRGMRAWSRDFGSLATEAEYRQLFREQGLCVQCCDDVTEYVRLTIPLLFRRVLSTMWTDPSAFRPLLKSPGFAVLSGIALAFTWLGYASGALRYVIVELEKP